MSKTPINDRDLAEIDARTPNDPHLRYCPITWDEYYDIRERLRLAEGGGGMTTGQCSACRPAFAEMHKLKATLQRELGFTNSYIEKLHKAEAERDAALAEAAKANSANSSIALIKAALDGTRFANEVQAIKDARDAALAEVKQLRGSVCTCDIDLPYHCCAKCATDSRVNGDQDND